MMNSHSDSGNSAEMVWELTTVSQYFQSTASVTVTAFISHNRQKAIEPSIRNNKGIFVLSLVNNLKQILLKQARI